VRGMRKMMKGWWNHRGGVGRGVEEAMWGRD
jgi:hypothetical protein